VCDLANALLQSSGMPDIWWGEATLTVCYVLNMVPSRNREATPYEGFKGRKPDLSHLWTWGCLAKVNVPLPKKRKLGPKTVDCVFLGYAHNSASYRFLVVHSKTSEVAVNFRMESRDVTFFESIFPMWDKEVVAPDGPSRTYSLPLSVLDQTLDLELRRSKRQRTEKSLGDDYIIYLVNEEPRSLTEAYTSPDAEYWREVVRCEMDLIISNGTWEITDLPTGCKPVGCKWIFRRKRRPDGTIEKYKACLVAKGFTQKKEEDYFDTYSPVARLPTIRVLLALVAAYKLLVHQMDVKTAFLNGELEEEIYIQQPEGFVVKGQESKVCRLIKSLYGLKQAPKQWHEKFNNILTTVGFLCKRSR
jgi:hypothetical protein